MSHITAVAVEGVEGESGVVDLDSFATAVAELGGEFKRGQKTYACYSGGWVGDTAPPAGWDPSMWGKCDHAASFPGCKYEIGLVPLDGTYRIMFDYYGADGLAKLLGGSTAPRLTALYAEVRNAVVAEERLLAEAAAEGLYATVESVAPGIRKVVVEL